MTYIHPSDKHISEFSTAICKSDSGLETMCRSIFAWLDDNGRVFLYFTQEEVMTMLDCGKDKATKLFRELEGIGLVERKKQGQGHPARIYVKNFLFIKAELKQGSDKPLFYAVLGIPVYMPVFNGGDSDSLAVMP